jgi:predicted enzyme related to lactoylglutathione lyase
MSFGVFIGPRECDMSQNPVVHLELHTGDLPRARETYAELLGWRAERIDTRAGPYVALDLGRELGGGIVECAVSRPLWLPYIEVPEIRAATDRARLLGASVLLEPREGPAGWRSVIATDAGGEIAFWQQKR